MADCVRVAHNSAGDMMHRHNDQLFGHDGSRCVVCRKRKNLSKKTKEPFQYRSIHRTMSAPSPTGRWFTSRPSPTTSCVCIPPTVTIRYRCPWRYHPNHVFHLIPTGLCPGPPLRRNRTPPPFSFWLLLLPLCPPPPPSSPPLPVHITRAGD